jgi:dihydroorotase
VAALWAGVADGTIDTIGSDHAPHLREEKLSGKAPSGVPGVQTILPLMLDAVHHGRLTLEHLVRLTSRNPACIFGLAGKGAVRVGADADLVLVNTEAQHTLRDEDQLTKPGWTPFAGRAVVGDVVAVWSRGRLVWGE